MKFSEEFDFRDRYIYDVTVSQRDTSFWKDTTGTSSATGNKLRMNATTVASYGQHLFGDFEFALNSVAPAGGLAKRWGLLNPSLSTRSAAYFDITGTAFTAVVIDDYGNSTSQTLTWSAGYTTVETRFRIIWEAHSVTFLISDVVVATFPLTPRSSSSASIATLPTQVPAALYIKNADADNLDLGYVLVRNSRIVV